LGAACSRHYNGHRPDRSSVVLIVSRRIAVTPGRPPFDGTIRREKQPQCWDARREIHIEHLAGFDLDVEWPEVDTEIIEFHAGQTETPDTQIDIKAELCFPDR
jgi:hypothetical protein